MATVTLPTVKEIRASGDRTLYPTNVLAGCESALVLFAAAFLGKQDACWIEEAGLTATCVDNDAARLDEMLSIYPETWTWVAGDAYQYAASQRHRRQWDVVSIDCPSGDSFERCAGLLALWCQLARRAVILGTDPGTSLRAPDGWRVTRRVRRSRIANWTVLERA